MTSSLGWDWYKGDKGKGHKKEKHEKAVIIRKDIPVHVPFHVPIVQHKYVPKPYPVYKNVHVAVPVVKRVEVPEIKYVERIKHVPIYIERKGGATYGGMEQMQGMQMQGSYSHMEQMQGMQMQGSYSRMDQMQGMKAPMQHSQQFDRFIRNRVSQGDWEDKKGGRSERSPSPKGFDLPKGYDTMNVNALPSTYGAPKSHSKLLAR